jgi:heme-degrading monooxygenase HmoA
MVRSLLNDFRVCEFRRHSGGLALSLMTERARFMASQPGFISVSVHRSLDGRSIVNYIQWQSRDL